MFYLSQYKPVQTHVDTHSPYIYTLTDTLDTLDEFNRLAGTTSNWGKPIIGSWDKPLDPKSGLTGVNPSGPQLQTLLLTATSCWNSTIPNISLCCIKSVLSDKILVRISAFCSLDGTYSNLMTPSSTNSLI